MEFTFDLCADCFEGVLEDHQLTLVSFNPTGTLKRCQACGTRIAAGRAVYRRPMTPEEAKGALVGASIAAAVLGGLAVWANRR